MKTLEFVSQYLSSPVVAHRERAMIALFKESQSNPQVMNQLLDNLKSRDFDLVLSSLKVLQSVSVHDISKLKGQSKFLVKLATETNHFSIALLCKEIISTLASIEPDLEKTSKLIATKVSPIINEAADEEYFYTNCDYSLEFLLGSQDFKYQLSHICRVFRYDCEKAAKRVLLEMKTLGHKKEKRYREDRPSRWRDDYYGNHYETKIFYYARHAIQIFLMWCVQNLPMTSRAWNELLEHERVWDPSIPSLLIEEQPSIVGNLDLSTNVDEWLKKRVSKEEVYRLIDLNSEWVPLYERTHFKNDDRSLDRYVATCCIKVPLGKFSKKAEMSVPHYRAETSFINELPLKAQARGALSVEDYNHIDSLEDKLVPNYGIASGEYDEFVKLFPAPEIIKHLNLAQRENTLDYYRGKELVIRSLNWRAGYEQETGNRGEDRFELLNYGHILLIKSAYLKKYLDDNGCKLLALGSLTKRKVKRWNESFDHAGKNSRYKRATIEIFG